jgi:hypothetical protein
MSSSLAAGAGCGSTTPMSEKSATASQADERSARPRHGGPSGRQLVGDYVGQPASEAAQDVRRAGLRPGLDRSFGCAPELVGQIVAQEPPAGSDLTRNGLVTLYVAAPGGTEPAADELCEPAPATPPPAAVPDMAEEDAPSSLAPRRRRKPGRAAQTRQVFDTPPAPIPPGERRPIEVPSQQHDATPVEEWEHDDAPELARSDQETAREEPDDRFASDELTDELVVHVDRMFAGRRGLGGGWPAWRRVYPRRGLRVRFAAHPWLFGITAAMVAVWAVVTVASALVGHAPGARRTSAPPMVVRHGGARPIGLSKPRRPAAHRAVEATRPRRRRAAPAAAVRPAAPASPAPVASAPTQPPPPASVPAAPAPAQAAPAAPSPPPAPAPAAEQTGGGPFSP